MLDFADAYTIWRRLPFPRSGSGEILPELHGDLALADEYVSTVIPYVEKGVYQPAKPDVLALLGRIRRQLASLAGEPDAELQTIIREQRAYAALLQVVYEQFLALSPPEGRVADGA